MDAGESSFGGRLQRLSHASGAGAQVHDQGLGIGGYTFVYAKGYSYLSNDPQACANGHIMRDLHTIQDRTFQIRNVAMGALMALITDIKTAKNAGSTDADLETPRRHQRRAQFLLDFIEAENSMGFHADQEAVRILALSIDETRRGQAALTGGRATPGPRTNMTATPQTVSQGTLNRGSGQRHREYEPCTLSHSQ